MNTNKNPIGNVDLIFAALSNFLCMFYCQTMPYKTVFIQCCVLYIKIKNQPAKE